jgi:hypothetical protein
MTPWSTLPGLRSRSYEVARFYVGADERQWLTSTRLPGRIRPGLRHLVVALGNAYTSWYRRWGNYGD